MTVIKKCKISEVFVVAVPPTFLLLLLLLLLLFFSCCFSSSFYALFRTSCYFLSRQRKKEWGAQTLWHYSTSVYKEFCSSIVLGLPVGSREMAKQVDWRSKATITSGLRLYCWDAWDTICDHKAKDIRPSIVSEANGIERTTVDALFWKETVKTIANQANVVTVFCKGSVSEKLLGKEAGWSADGLSRSRTYQPPWSGLIRISFVFVVNMNSSCRPSLTTKSTQNVYCYGLCSSEAPIFYLSHLPRLYTPSRQLRSSAGTQVFRIPCSRFKPSGQHSFCYQTWSAAWNQLLFLSAMLLCQFFRTFLENRSLFKIFFFKFYCSEMRPRS